MALLHLSRQVALVSPLAARQVALVSPLAARQVALASRHKHTLPDLAYDYGALEPHVSAEIMKLHHSAHHQTYVTQLNVAEEKLAEAQARNDVSAIVSLQSALKFHGGGHINHSIFWQNLSPSGGGEPGGALAQAINRDFGSVENMKSLLATTTAAIQGSGWGWLGYNKTMKRLQIATCANQDPLEPTTGLVPLLGIDVWEHAYYLQYRGARPDYIKGLWNVVNWQDVADRLAKASA